MIIRGVSLEAEEIYEDVLLLSLIRYPLKSYKRQNISETKYSLLYKLWYIQHNKRMLYKRLMVFFNHFGSLFTVDALCV